ncbi:MAG: hypothetical protein ACO3JH_02625 [Flavobacteriaceae bacterium]
MAIKKKKNPEPPKGTTLKASNARYSETRQQFRDKMADKYHYSDLGWDKDNNQHYRKFGMSSFKSAIRDDDEQRQTGLKSKDKGMIGMSEREEIGGNLTKYGKAVQAVKKVGETSKAASKKKPISMQAYSDGMAYKANKSKGQTLKATPVKAKTGPSSVKMPAKPTAKKKGR